tara:strand:- start:60 stop:248 length:189 start_codon:yes stop_codon:yes gene_type:complete
MKNGFLKSFWNEWVNAGWTSFALSVIFFFRYFMNSNKTNLYLSIGFLIVAITQLVIKYKNKI